MQKVTTTEQNQALAAAPDVVYSAITFEQMFDASGSERQTDEQQVQAETNPHPLTQMALAGAGNPTSTKGLLMTLALLKQQYTAVVSHPTVLDSSDERAVAALVCARHAAAHLAESFADLGVDDRYDIIFESFHRADENPRVEEFWTLLSNLLYGYAGHMMEPGWEPTPGLLPDGDDAALSMPVWRTESGRFVSDLLVFMTPWDTDEEVRQHVVPAMERARAVFGERFGGVRVVPPLASYLTRWYHPDGTWEMWFEDVPDFHAMLDEALSEAAQS